MEGISQQLTNDLLKAINLVKDALTLADSQQKALKEKAQQMKNQIQDDVSLHLELLRNREVWLLEQVEIVLQLKEELLEGNQKELCVLLAKLELYLELIQGMKLASSAEDEVVNVLSSINYEQLNLEESPDLNFIVNNFALSDAIKNFGSIVEEVQGHVGKLRVPVGRKKYPAPRWSSGQDIRFLQEHFNAVFSSPTHDWLLPSSSGSELIEDAGVPGFKKFCAGLKKSETKSWLYEEDQPIDSQTAVNGFSQHFNKVKQEPIIDWLRPSLDGPPTNDSIQFTPFQVPERLHTWILSPETLSDTTEGSDLGERSSICVDQDEYERSSVGSMEVETGVNDGWLLPGKDIDQVSTSIESIKLEDKANTEQWLLPDGCAKSEGEKTNDENWLQRFQETMGKSTSDWLIVSEVEPEYCEWLTRESIDRCKQCPGECARDTFKAFRNIVNSSSNEWLKTAIDW